MALSYYEYTANGVQVNYASKLYVEEAHLVVSLDGVAQASSTYTVSGTTLTFNSPPPTGTIIRIGRNSNQDARLTNYEDASLLTADVMDDDANQLFFMAQEAIDTASETNVGVQKFYNASATAPVAPAIGDLWYDTYNKYLKIYNGTQWDLATPSNETYTFDNSSFVVEGVNYHYINVANLTQDAFVFLNGVKLVEGSTQTSVVRAVDPTDYYLDLANNRVYFATLDAADVVEIVIAPADLGTNNNTQLETFTATAGQTIFNLTKSYIPATNTLHVYVNGVRQSAYTETNATTVTFTNGLSVGDEVTFITNQYKVAQGFTAAENVTYTPTGGTATTVDSHLKVVDAKLAETVSVKDFGAKGDGVTDDTAAMNAAHATGKVIFYPSGTYLFTTLDDISTGGILGNGRSETILKSTDTGSSDLITFTGSASAPVFQDFTLKASSSGDTPVKTGGAGLKLDAVTGEIGYTYMSNVTIAFVPTAFKTIEASYMRIDSCEFLGYDTAGMDIDNDNNPDSGDSVIMGCLFNTPASTGTSIIHRASGGLKVIGNKMLGGSTGYSLNFEGSNNTSILLFHGNSVENMTNQCMTFSRTGGTYNFSNITITGNEFGVGPTGIQDDASDFIDQFICVGNIFNLYPDTSGYGVNLNSVTDFVISSNTFQGNGGAPAAIVIGANCVNGKIGGDNIYSGISTVTNNSATTTLEKNRQAGSSTTSSSSWSAYGSLYNSPSTTVVFPKPYIVAPLAEDIHLSAAGLNGEVSAVVTSVSTTGFTYVGLGTNSNIAAVYTYEAYGIA